MSQGFYTFSILCVTGATHSHTATPYDLQNSQDLGRISKSENVIQILYVFILCVTGATHSHTATPDESRESRVESRDSRVERGERGVERVESRD